MAEYKVVEKFVSINGEGVLAGQLSVFIRFKGCNLNCSFCDTQWANSADTEYNVMTEEDIYSYIESTGVRNVTLTGGEPLLQKDIVCLLELLSKHDNIRVEIETNGSVSLRTFLYTNATFTMDYKLACSGMEDKMDLDNLKLLRHQDTVKFVVGSRTDLERAEKVITEYNMTRKCHVYISPVFGMIELTEIVQYMVEHKMNNVNMQMQMHKIIWNPNARGV